MLIHPAIARAVCGPDDVEDILDLSALAIDLEIEMATWKEGRGKRGALIAINEAGRVLHGQKARRALSITRGRERRGTPGQRLNRNLVAGKAAGVRRSGPLEAGRLAEKGAKEIAAKRTPAKPTSGKAIRTEAVKEKATPQRGKVTAERKKETPKPAAGRKEPWQMTREEHAARKGHKTRPKEPLQPRPIAKMYGTNGPTPQQAEEYKGLQKKYRADKRQYDQDYEAYLRSEYGADSHRKIVEAALAAGKPVPPEVLADYPDLGQKQPEAKQPQSMNREQFLKSRGMTFDPMSDAIAMDSPSGRQSGRAHDAAQERFKTNYAAYTKLLDEYQRLVDAGEIVDPSGKFKPTLREQTREYTTAKGKVAQLLSNNETMRQVGMGQRGKLKPKYQAVVDRNLAELQQLYRDYPELAPK